MSPIPANRQARLNGAVKWGGVAIGFTIFVASVVAVFVRTTEETKALAIRVAGIEEERSEQIRWIRQVDRRLATIEGFMKRSTEP